MKQFPAYLFKKIPNSPGVYIMLDEDGEILYIGKAKRLRKRVFSYRQVKRGTHPPHQIELMSRVRELRWEPHRTEALALEREYELLHAIRPPYNIADTEEQSYVFITMRAKPASRTRSEGDRPLYEVEFQLTSEPDGSDDVKVFGCYKDRWQARRGFGALLRLLHSATYLSAASGQSRPRFWIPAALRRPRMDQGFLFFMDEKEITAAARFLRGASLEFLRSISQSMIENDEVPRFMGPSLQDDLDCAREFFRTGPKSTRSLKRQNQLKARVLSHRDMDKLIRGSLQIETLSAIALP